MESEEMVDPLVNKKHAVKNQRNRKTKIHLVFSEESRKDFLTGFKKRKDERRKKAREEMEIQLKEDKKRLKEEQRDKVKKFFGGQRTIPEVEDILKPVVYDLPEHVVTISTNTDVDLVGHDNLRLGLNKGVNEQRDLRDETSENEKDDADVSNSDKLQRNALKKGNQTITCSKAFQMKERIKQKKDRQRTRSLKMKNKNCKVKKKNLLKRSKSSHK